MKPYLVVGDATERDLEARLAEGRHEEERLEVPAEGAERRRIVLHAPAQQQTCTEIIAVLVSSSKT